MNYKLRKSNVNDDKPLFDNTGKDNVDSPQKNTLPANKSTRPTNDFEKEWDQWKYLLYLTIGLLTSLMIISFVSICTSKTSELLNNYFELAKTLVLSISGFLIGKFASKKDK